MEIVFLIFYGISVLLLVLASLWIVIPAFYGLPSKPTKPDRIRRALELADLQPDETLYDLGAGDGRVLLIAAREYGAKVVGVDIGPVQCMLSWLKVIKNGLGSRVQVKLKNFYKLDLTTANVVFIYGTSRESKKLAPFLKKQMKSGSRLVSISADFPEWEPTKFDEQDLIFVYEMPPKDGSLLTYMLKNTK